jgi:histamine receptor H3
MNVTASGEAVSEELSWSTAEVVCIGAFLSLVILTNIAGNTLTILAFVRDKRLQIVQNLYVLNLAVTDLIIGVCIIPFSVMYTFNNYTWPFSRVVCKVYSTLDYWACAESSLTIILISYDRLLMVRDGIAYNQQQTKRRAGLKIGVSWVLSFLLYGPAIIGYDLWRGYSELEDGECDVEFASDVVFLLVTAVIEFFIPFVLLTGFNSLLYWNIRQRSHKIADAACQSADKAKRLHRDKKAAKSLALLVCLYAICWSPFTLYAIVSSATGYEGGPLLYEVLAWLLWLNSSLNPICYAITNRHFRTQYRRMLCACCTTCSSRHTDTRVVPLSTATTPT